jgi:hypothetical protein
MEKYQTKTIENRNGFFTSSVITKILVVIVLLFILNQCFFSLGGPGGDSTEKSSTANGHSANVGKKMVGGLSVLHDATAEIQTLIDNVYLIFLLINSYFFRLNKNFILFLVERRS